MARRPGGQGVAFGLGGHIVISGSMAGAVDREGIAAKVQGR